MKKYLLLLISWGVFASVAAQDSLRGRLDSLLCDPMFETSQVGLMVYDLTADSALFTYNHRQLMRPASCMKLVTAITALDQLGANYDYQTRIYMTGNVNYSTLEGNIYCVGGFDPTLTIDDVAVLANCVSRLGIDSIHGLIVADRTMKEALDYVREQLAADELAEIRAQVDRSYRYHMNPSDCVTRDTMVMDLLEEYGQENGLPEGWWMEQGDIDDILLKL